MQLDTDCDTLRVMVQKGTTGTHYKAAASRKTAQILVRFTPGELDRIKTRANKKGVSLSQFAHDALIKSITPNKRAKRSAK